MSIALQNDQDISAYTVEMTLDMQNRIKMLKQIKSRKFSQNRSKTNELASTKSITNHMVSLLYYDSIMYIFQRGLFLSTLNFHCIYPRMDIMMNYGVDGVIYSESKCVNLPQGVSICLVNDSKHSTILASFLQ